MSTEKTLIPVFIPPLATVLALAEKNKGSALTQPEVEAIRDQSACIMMQPADAEKMAGSHGFVDVNPANCWADWHRLRVQLTGKGYLPRIILCIPGGRDLRARCEPILTAEKIEHEFRPHDPQMSRAFRASSATWPEFTPEEFARIESHESVLYASSDHLVAAAAPAVAHSFLDLGLRLLEAGGIAIKCDSSGISHPLARWAKFVANADRSAAERWNVLFHAFVVNPIRSSDDFYTCGMQLLGAPDLIISQSAAKRSATAAQQVTSAVITLFRVFANYLLAECPVGKFASGHTFSIDRDAPRYRLIWEPCFGYPEDNFFFNPFGRWRFTEP